ncbi:MAG: GspMb/PilO family protein [bacterium]
MKLLPKQKELLYITSGLLVVIFILIFLINSMNNILQGVKNEIRQNEKKYSSAIAIFRQKETIEKIFHNYEPYLSINGSDEEITTKIFNEVQKIAQDAGMPLSSSKTQAAPDPQKDSKKYKKYIIKLTSNSHIDRLIQFLYAIYQSKLLLQVEDISIATKSKRKTKDVELTITISLSLVVLETKKNNHL